MSEIGACSIYVLVADGEMSPVWENPLGLFSNYRGELEEEYEIQVEVLEARGVHKYKNCRINQYGFICKRK